MAAVLRADPGPLRMTERVLCLELADLGLARGFATLGEVRTIQWSAFPPEALRREIRLLVSEWRPTLVFAHLSRGATGFDAVFVRELRILSPGVVVVQGDWDVYDVPASPRRQWYVDLGRECDASLIATSSWREAFAELGVKRPGWMAPGVDTETYSPTHDRDATVSELPVIALANAHGPNYPLYAHRNDLLRRVARAFPFLLYGHGWEGSGLPCQGPRGAQQESGVYGWSCAALCISMRNDLARYTSDRLFRCLASGGVPVVEQFPETGAVGLIDGRNCMLFDGWPQLSDTLDRILRGWVDTAAIRRGALEMRLRHTWAMRARELGALAHIIRGYR